MSIPGGPFQEAAATVSTANAFQNGPDQLLKMDLLSFHTKFWSLKVSEAAQKPIHCSVCAHTLAHSALGRTVVGPAPVADWFVRWWGRPFSLGWFDFIMHIQDHLFALCRTSQSGARCPVCHSETPKQKIQSPITVVKVFPLKAVKVECASCFLVEFPSLKLASSWILSQPYKPWVLWNQKASKPCLCTPV